MHSFSKAHRLCKADEFSSVFIFRKVRFGKFFKIHFKPNELAHSRLGFMVSKKIHKRASQRNYIKRIIREYFRTHQHSWLAQDLIVRAQRHFTRMDLSEVIAELDSLCAKFRLNTNVAKNCDSHNS